MAPDEPTDDFLERAARLWVEHHRRGEAAEDWVEDAQLQWRVHDQFAALWRFILVLCRTVPDDDPSTIGQIGVGPLYDLVRDWPDAALEALEAEAPHNPTIVTALTSVITATAKIGKRVDDIVARNKPVAP